jgi:heme-degrading monooxygenase HmoA
MVLLSLRAAVPRTALAASRLNAGSNGPQRSKIWSDRAEWSYAGLRHKKELGCYACTKPNSILEHRIMKEMVYTLAAWRVQEGRQQAFISAWKGLGEAFNSLFDSPGKGVLIQSTSDPTLFYSFVPWNSMEAVEAMRNDHHAIEGIKTLEGLCTEATPGSFHVVAESP